MALNDTLSASVAGELSLIRDCLGRIVNTITLPVAEPSAGSGRPLDPWLYAYLSETLDGVFDVSVPEVAAGVWEKPARGHKMRVTRVLVALGFQPYRRRDDVTGRRPLRFQRRIRHQTAGAQ